MTTATGPAAPSMPSATYVKKIALTIKNNIRSNTKIEGNPLAVVRVDTTIDGRITSRHLIQSSGVVDWDTAVLNAIDRTERFPIEANETLPRAIEFHFRPKE